MKNCTDCTHAQWDRTKVGRLHPDGLGKCTFPVKLPQLPPTMRWSVLSPPPKPMGGHISRRVELPQDCAFYSRKQP